LQFSLTDWLRVPAIRAGRQTMVRLRNERTKGRVLSRSREATPVQRAQRQIERELGLITKLVWKDIS